MDHETLAEWQSGQKSGKWFICGIWQSSDIEDEIKVKK